MAKVTLVTGGARSGKSRYAQAQAEAIPGERIYVATCPVLDDEMAARIEKHQADRADKGWETLQVETDLAQLLRVLPSETTVLVDCLTLWVNNLMFHSEADISEEMIAAEASAIVQTVKQRDGTTFFVANEGGMGIVPDNALARRYRDLAGRVNQVIAAEADAVILMVSGLPVQVK